MFQKFSTVSNPAQPRCSSPIIFSSFFVDSNLSTFRKTSCGGLDPASTGSVLGAESDRSFEAALEVAVLVVRESLGGRGLPKRRQRRRACLGRACLDLVFPKVSPIVVPTAVGGVRHWGRTLPTAVEGRDRPGGRRRREVVCGRRRRHRRDGILSDQHHGRFLFLLLCHTGRQIQKADGGPGLG